MVKRIFEKAFNACVCFVYRINRYDSVSAHACDLLGNDLFVYHGYLTSSFLHKVICSKEFGNVYDNLTFGSSARTRNLILPRNDKNIINSSERLEVQCATQCLERENFVNWLQAFLQGPFWPHQPLATSNVNFISSEISFNLMILLIYHIHDGIGHKRMMTDWLFWFFRFY